MTDPAPCPLCGRPIPEGARASQHHLVPRLKGGKGGPTVRLHQICHSAIHARFTEAEIARDYPSIVALRAHPGLGRFIAWVREKPSGFHAPTCGGPRRRRR
jgi:hypothetical protein